MKSFEHRKLIKEPIGGLPVPVECNWKWKGLSWNYWIIILIITCILIFHIQIFFLFGVSQSEDESDIPECLPQVEVNFADNYTGVELSGRLWREWQRISEHEDRLLYNQREGKDVFTVILPMLASDDLAALISYVNMSTLYEKLHNSVLVVLLDSDMKQLDILVLKIINLFHHEIDIGFIRLIQPPFSFFIEKTDGISLMEILSPNVTSRDLLRRTAAWLEYVSPFVHFSCQYCILADVHYEAVHRFLSLAKERVKKQNKRLINWSLLESGSYDNIDDDEDDKNVEHISGWLIRSEDIYKLSYFLKRTTVADVTIIETINLFRLSVSQKSRVIMQTPIFRPVGISEALRAEGFSSSKRWKGDDPQAVIVSNMNPVEQHGIHFVYARDYGYFRASAPRVGDWIAIVFDRDDVALSRVGVETGNDLGGFPLRGGIIEASPRLLRLDVNKRILTCADFVAVGAITSDQRWVEFDQLDKKLWGRSTKCLRLLITGEDPVSNAQHIPPDPDQSELKKKSDVPVKSADVIFAQIAVFT